MSEPSYEDVAMEERVFDEDRMVLEWNRGVSISAIAVDNGMSETMAYKILWRRQKAGEELTRPISTTRSRLKEMRKQAKR
jgi:hypothetical protein